MNNKEILIVSAVFPPEPVVSASLSYDLALALSINERVIVISPLPSRPFGFEFGKIVVSDKFKHYQLNSFTCPESKLFGSFLIANGGGHFAVPKQSIIFSISDCLVTYSIQSELKS